MSKIANARTASPVLDWESLRPEVTEELLTSMARRIVDAFHPYSIILFGSYAYGTPHRDSDVDLLVIMDTEVTMAERIMCIRKVAKAPFLPMDVIVYTPTEIQRRLEIGDFFIKEILEKGRVLYEHGSSR